jgi:hypothetical protein
MIITSMAGEGRASISESPGQSQVLKSSLETDVTIPPEDQEDCLAILFEILKKHLGDESPYHIIILMRISDYFSAKHRYEE